MYKDFNEAAHEDDRAHAQLRALLASLKELGEPQWMCWPDKGLRDALANWLKPWSDDQRDDLIAALDGDLAPIARTVAEGICTQHDAMKAFRLAIELAGAGKKSWSPEPASRCLSALHRNGALQFLQPIRPVLRSMERSGLRLSSEGQNEVLRGHLLSHFSERGDGAIIRRQINALFGVETKAVPVPSPPRDPDFRKFLQSLADHFAELHRFRERLRPFPDITTKLRGNMVSAEILAQIGPPDVYRGHVHRLEPRPRTDGVVRAGHLLAKWPWFPIFEAMDTPLIDSAWIARQVLAYETWEARFGAYRWLDPEPPAALDSVPKNLLTHLRSAAATTPSRSWRDRLARLDSDENRRTTLLDIITATLSAASVAESEARWQGARHCAFLHKKYMYRMKYSFTPEASAIDVMNSLHELPWNGESPGIDDVDNPIKLSKSNALVVKGAAWGLSSSPDAEVIDALAAGAEALAAPVLDPWRGPQPRSLSAAAACVWALGEIATGKATVALRDLSQRIADPRLQKNLQAAIGRSHA